MDTLTALSALPKGRFYFLRHGETVWNKQGLAQGRTDIPLNQAGRDQADQARPLLDGHGMARIITSPLSRASETAEIINRTLNLPMDYHSGLMERSFGPFEGQPWTPAWYHGGPGEGAEPEPAFVERIMTTLVELLERPGPLLLVSHGGVFRIVADLLCALPEARSANAVPFRFDPPADGETRWTLHPVDPVRA
jgi:broad specificity phosphatase PhoE